MGALNEIPQDRPDAYGKGLLIVLIPKKTLLGAFAKLRKATVNIVMSARPFVRPRRTTRLPSDGF